MMVMVESGLSRDWPDDGLDEFRKEISGLNSLSLSLPPSAPSPNTHTNTIWQNGDEDAIARALQRSLSAHSFCANTSPSPSSAINNSTNI